MMIKDFDSRLRRLEKRRRAINGINPITEALKHIPLERLERVLIGTGLVSVEEVRRVIRDIKSDIPN